MTPMLIEIKELIGHNLDVEEFLDIIGLELIDIVDRFDDEILENLDALIAATS